MQRTLEKYLNQSLKNDRAVALLGPRQTGKSYLLGLLAQNEDIIVKLDDPAVRDQAKRDPVAYLRNRRKKTSRLFIDEPTKLPVIFDAIKVLIDECGLRPSGIALASSSNYLLMRRIKESLAGRTHILKLFPLTWPECIGSAGEPGLFRLDQLFKKLDVHARDILAIERSRNEYLAWGGFAPVVMSEPKQKENFLKDYVAQFILPLTSEGFRGIDIPSFETTARLLLGRTAQLVNYQAVAGAVGITHPTVKSYEHILEAMLVILRIRPYLSNVKKRLTKGHKIFSIDLGLTHAVLGTGHNAASPLVQNLWGAIYETFVVSEIYKTLSHRDENFNLYFWRTVNGTEVDLVMDFKGELWAFEIKSSNKVGGRDILSLRSFLELHPNCKGALLVYPGETVLRMDKKIWAVPDWWLLAGEA